MGPVLETSFFPLSRYSKLFSRPQKGPTAVACAVLALTPESLASRRVFPQTKPQPADFGLISVVCLQHLPVATHKATCLICPCVSRLPSLLGPRSQQASEPLGI